MKYTIEKRFSNLTRTCAGWSYHNFADLLHGLIYEMRDKIGPFKLEDQHHNLRFVMNPPFYREFSIACQMGCYEPYTYRGIRIVIDQNLYMSDAQFPEGVVRLIHEEEPELKKLYEKYCVEDAKSTYQLMITPARNSCRTFFLPSAKPHIDHVIFNGPATIVFWKDGTKTVVKHDGKGLKDKRQAILYAFIRKIYGEGKPYHNILNEIEEAIK